MFQVFINLLRKHTMSLGVFIIVCSSVTYVETLPAEQVKGHSPIAVTFEEGKHYVRLKSEITTNKTVQALLNLTPGKIQVIEFFNYACFGCSRLHPAIETWVKKKPVMIEFFRFPVVFHQGWEQLAKAFYVIKELQKLDILDPLMFSTLHEKHINLTAEPLLTQFFVENGVPEKTFLDLYHSFLVSNELAKGKEIASAYQIAESPVVIVNGPSNSYLLSPTKAGSIENFIAILNYVVSLESKVLAGS